MNRLFMNIVFCCLSITTGIYGMLSLEDTHVPRKGVLTLQEIISNTLAQEKAHSYLSRPTCSELSKTDDALVDIPEDLLAEATSTQPKNISLAHIHLYKNITGLVACSDPNKVVMTSPDGSLIAIDVITKAIHHKKISFESIRIHLNDEKFDESTDSSSSSEKFINQSDTSSDYAFSSDDERNNDDWTSALSYTDCVVVNHKSINDPEKYIGTAVSSNGQVWGAISPDHNDRLLIGSVDALFDPEEGEYAQGYNQINLAENFGSHHCGELKELALRSDGLQCAAVWESISSRFTETQKLLFWQDKGGVQETVEMPRIHKIVYATSEPLLAVGHENGVVSFWGTQEAMRHSAFQFFNPKELITAMRFSHDDTIIYLGTVAGNLTAFNRLSQKNNSRHAHDKTIKIIQSHPQGLCVVTAADDGKVILWNKDVTKKIAELKLHVTALNFSHDGTFLYVVTEDKQFHRIPLGNPLELLCLRACIACQNELKKGGSFKNWGIYKKVIAQGQKERGILGEQLRKYLAMYAD